MSFDWGLIGNVACSTDIPQKYKDDIKTERQWALLGYVPRDESGGNRLWSNHFCNGAFTYLHRDEVREADKTELDSFFAAERKQRNKREKARRKALREERERMEALRILEEQEREKERLFLEAREKYIAECRLASEKMEQYDLRTSSVIVLDTETTGLDPSRDELLQISILDGTDGSVLFDSFVKPTLATEWHGAMAVNGITPEMVANAPDILSLVPLLNYIMRDAKVLIAYNGSFDMAFLKAFGVDLSAIQSVVDVMKDFAVVYGDWNDYHKSFTWKKLTVCASYFGYEWGKGEAHNSCEDCKATLYCYKKMQEPKFIEIYEKNMGLAYEQSEEGDSQYY